MITLFNHTINDDVDKDFETIVEELENNFDQSDVDYFTDTVDLVYNEEQLIGDDHNELRNRTFLAKFVYFWRK